MKKMLQASPSSTLTAADSNKQETSIKIFRRFLKVTRVNANEVVYDASRVVSRECYEAWLSNRTLAPSDPARVFQRSLSSHVTSVDGRQPFSPKEEEAILKVLRKKQIWCALTPSSFLQARQSHEHA